MKSVFLASTPLQVICCTEARHHYPVSEKVTIYLVKPDNNQTCEQMKFILEKMGWSKSEQVWLGKKSYYLRLLSHIRRLLREKIDYLFVGNPGSAAQELFFNNICSEHTVFVDDGVATLKYAAYMDSNGLKSSLSPAKKSVFSFLGLKCPGIYAEKIEFFTVFDILPCSRFTVSRNTLDVFSDIFVSGNDSDWSGKYVGYIGHPGRKEADYIRMREHIDFITKRHPGSVIHYFMHRKERFEKVAEVLSGIAVEIKTPGKPIEVEVAFSKDGYIAFYSFISTALYTLKLVFPSVQVFRVSEPGNRPDYEHYDSIVEQMEKIGVGEVNAQNSE